MKPHIGDCRFQSGRSNCSGHIGLTVPDVKAALAHLEKYNVEVFKPLGVASNETIPVPDGMTPIVPGYADVYKQIAMIRVFLSLA
jgi:lactoylglutathione lyase